MIRQFNRFELKYLMRSSTRDALLDELRAHVTPDPHGGGRGIYRVTSLYYDTRDLACYRAKIDGVKFRRKLRIRRYGECTDELDAEAMVEIKQRIGRTTQKRRFTVPLRDAYELCGGSSWKEWSDPRDAAVAGEVTFLALALQLVPASVIGYIRHAFIGSPYEPGLRITFDHGLWSSVPDPGLVDSAARHAILPPDWLIMEVKVDNAIPLWVSHLLARHNVALQRYSKYCAGLARLHQIQLASAPSQFDPGQPSQIVTDERNL